VRFRNGPWRKAFDVARVEYRRPYAMRHTFAAWALLVEIHPSRVVALMGHGSKQMLYDVYAQYTAGIEADVDAIRAYLGTDFS
jgi:integrase